MTTTENAPTTAPTAPARRPAPAGRAERNLRETLTLNAATSLVAGVAGLAAAGWWSGRLGIDGPGWTRLVSAGLLVFAAAVLAVSRARPDRLRAGAAVVSAADLSWVAATAALLAAGAFNGTGVAVAVAMAVGVLAFATLQLRFRSTLPA
jgi:hypothetical protein